MESALASAYHKRLKQCLSSVFNEIGQISIFMAPDACHHIITLMRDAVIEKDIIRAKIVHRKKFKKTVKFTQGFLIPKCGFNPLDCAISGLIHKQIQHKKPPAWKFRLLAHPRLIEDDLKSIIPVAPSYQVRTPIQDWLEFPFVWDIFEAPPTGLDVSNIETRIVYATKEPIPQLMQSDEMKGKSLEQLIALWDDAGFESYAIDLTRAVPDGKWKAINAEVIPDPVAGVVLYPPYAMAVFTSKESYDAYFQREVARAAVPLDQLVGHCIVIWLSYSVYEQSVSKK